MKKRFMDTLKAVFSQAVAIVLRFAVAYPLSFYLYTVGLASWHCFGKWWDVCLFVPIIAPLVGLMGPIAHDEEDPVDIYTPVLEIALLVTLVWTFVAFLRRIRRPY